MKKEKDLDEELDTIFLGIKANNERRQQNIPNKEYMPLPRRNRKNTEREITEMWSIIGELKRDVSQLKNKIKLLEKLTEHSRGKMY